MRRNTVLSILIVTCLAGMLAGCGASMNGAASSYSSVIMIAWLFIVSSIGLFTTGCGGESSASFPPNTSTGTLTPSPSPSSSPSSSPTTPVQIPVKLAFLSQPVQAQSKAGEAQATTVLPAIQVAIEDANGSVVTSATNPVTIALGNDPSGATLSGTLTQNAVNGIATFSDLRISKAGTSFTLVASSPGLAGATSVSFTILPLSLHFNARVDSSNTFGVPFQNEEGNYLVQATLADVNNDGIPDAILLPYYGKFAQVMLGRGDGTFQAAVNTPSIGGDPQSTEVAPLVGDFNGDGKLDLAIANDNYGYTYIMLSNGDGTFTSTANLAGGGSGIALGDFDHDGNLDVATTSYSGSVTVYFGNGNGTFATGVSTSVGSELSRMVVGDFNNDGVTDLAVIDEGSSSHYLDLLLGNSSRAAVFTNLYQKSLNFKPVAMAGADLNGTGTPDLVLASNTAVVPLLDVAPGTSGTISFTAGTNVGGYADISQLAAADLNLDGKGDVVVNDFGVDNNPSPPFISVLLGTGSGSFGAAQNYPVGGYEYAQPSITDVNGDGKPDILVAGYYDFAATIYLNHGDGTFQQAPQMTEPGQAVLGTQMSLVDLNGDAKSDLVFASNNGIIVQRGNGDGTFAAATNITLSNVVSVVAADVNSDGKADLIATTNNGTQPQVYELLGNGDGTFASATFLGNLPTSSHIDAITIAIADVNGDSKPDILTVEFNESSSSGNVSILLNQGGGNFTAPTSVVTGIKSTAIAVGDLNGDGKPDLVVANYTSVGVFKGNGDGTFASPSGTVVSLPDGVWGIAIGDINNDGKPDLVLSTGFSSSGGVVTLLGNGDLSFGAPTNIQLGHNPGVIDYKDESGGLVLADLNNDGNLDIVLTDWYDEVWALPGDGKGNFTAVYGFGDTNLPANLAVGDINGDGRADIVVVDSYHSTVTTIMHQ